MWIIQCTLNIQELKGWFKNFTSAINSLASESKDFQPYLFQFKDVLVKIVLQALVGKVDAELFKTIIFVVFKPKNIKYSNG